MRGWVQLFLFAILIGSEAVAQFSTPDFARAWYVVRDANYNAVAVVDDAGDVRRQRAFNPYGELLFEETFAASGGPSWNPVVRMGHQGLFYDRLNGDYAATPITMVSKGLYHNRNRSYSPHLGRFVQSDPNATGVLIAAGGMRGARLGIDAGVPDLEGLLGDGFSLYQAYGSGPTMNTDSQGLFFSLVGMALSLHTSADIQANYNDQGIDAGLSMADFIDIQLNDYGLQQEVDLDWASDWSAPDDWLDPWGGSVSTSVRDPMQMPRSSGDYAVAGWNRWTQRGMEIHKKWSTKFSREAGWITNHAIPGTRLRPDAINDRLGIIVELKPNNPRAIALGRKQLEKYKEAAERYYGRTFEVILEVYD